MPSPDPDPHPDPGPAPSPNLDELHRGVVDVHELELHLPGSQVAGEPAERTVAVRSGAPAPRQHAPRAVAWRRDARATYLPTSTHLRVLRRHLVRHAPPEPAAVEHVGLVDHGQPAAPLLRRGERELERPADLVDRVLAHVGRLVALRLVLAEVEAAQQLAGKRRERGLRRRVWRCAGWCGGSSSGGGREVPGR